MSTAVATATPALHSGGVDRVSPHHHQYSSMGPAPTSSSNHNSNNGNNNNNITSAPASVDSASRRARSIESPTAGGGTQQQPGLAEKRGAGTGSGKNSPASLRTEHPPSVKVKKEPGSSPSMPTSRPRPKRLDLSSSLSNGRGPQTARPSAPLTSRESAGLAIQDVGLACLSPGFATHDPAMREQLQRSLDVRDQQRMIIEARQKGGGKPGSSHADEPPQTAQDTTLFGVQTRTPATSRRKGPPPALSIAAPSAAQFANDRVVQSAPLNQTFTGLHPGDSQHPYSRHAQHGPSGLSQTSHIHHVPATQTNNRLPPIADVFANDRLDGPRTGNNNNSPNHLSNNPPTTGGAQQPPQQQQTLPSPSFPPPSQHQTNPATNAPPNSRQREFRSAEEAVAGLSGGRDELLPKVVHYGGGGGPHATSGAQPPTPPSPLPPQHPYNHHPPPHHSQHIYDCNAHAYAHQPSTAGPRTTFSIPDPPGQTASSGASAYPAPGARPTDTFARTASMNGRRRGREEFEQDLGSSPLQSQQQQQQGERGEMWAPDAKRMAFGRGGGEEEEHGGARERERFWRQAGGAGAGAGERGVGVGAGLSAEQKREEFLRLCERAWDLLHS